MVQIPALRLPAEDGGSPAKLLSSPLSGFPSKASIAAALKEPAVKQLPRKAQRSRIAWDSQLRQRAFWLVVFLCVLGETRRRLLQLSAM